MIADVEYVYLTIPAKYVCIYHKLLVYLSDFGESAIKNCKAICEGSNINIIQCWNIFQSALACYTLGLVDKADFFIKYIEAQLDLNYKGTDKQVYCNEVNLPISEDGYLKSVVSCVNNEVTFVVDEETGHLYQKYLEDKNPDKNYIIENDHLMEIK